MLNHRPRPEPSRRTHSSFIAVVVAASAILVGVFGYQLLAVSSSSATSTVAALLPSMQLPPGALLRDRGGAVGVADGTVPDGVTVFDDRYAAVANLEPGLLGALRRAATDAKRDGATLVVNSGWRSPAYQAQLLREAVAQYGSEEEAARWVATPDTSPHVAGAAVDIGPTKAADWLARHGASYGLCQIYGNEPWHFELRPEAVRGGCPRMYDDPTYDPRMQP